MTLALIAVVVLAVLALECYWAETPWGGPEDPDPWERWYV